MSILKSHLLLLILGSLLLLTSCGTADKRQTATILPRAAIAPTLKTASSTSISHATPEIKEKIVPKPDPVAVMIADAEREYQAGQANYAAGHLDAAKQNFDNAFDLLTTGAVQIKSDSRLQDEFEKIVAGTHDLELQALQQGDGFTQQSAQPAPIDEANDVTFPVDPKVKAAAEAELKATVSDLPLVMNDYVASYINFFSHSAKGRATLEHAFTRAGLYRAMIERVLKQEGVPQDLIYLAQAESGFHPLAVSRAAARGMWQFMGDRAKGYGLTRNWWIDERQDPEKSTRAAARHLKDLYNEFGDWYLAMAAYNSGPGNVQHAVQRTGFADFWELYKRGVLPKETKNYVPIILAMTIIAKNPRQYGLQDIEPDRPLEMDKIKINYPVDLRLVAECVDASVDSLQELNPSLLRMTTPKAGEFELHLPAGSESKFEAAIAAIPADKRVWWRYHKVTTGETLASVARQYHTTPAAITDVNGLGSDEITPDAKLIIPMAVGRHAPGEMEAMVFSRHLTRYKVRHGDTVLSVADDFSVPPDKLRKWNHLRGNSLRAGRRLVIYRPVAEGSRDAQTLRAAKPKPNKYLAAAAKNGHRTHTVRSGETLYSIANSFGTTVEALKRDNHRVSANLRPGDVLVVK